MSASHRVGPADCVGDVSAEGAKPVALHRLLSRQLEAEQQVLLLSGRMYHQGEGVHTLCTQGRDTPIETFNNKQGDETVWGGIVEDQTKTTENWVKR